MMFLPYVYGYIHVHPLRIPSSQAKPRGPSAILHAAKDTITCCKIDESTGKCGQFEVSSKLFPFVRLTGVSEGSCALNGYAKSTTEVISVKSPLGEVNSHIYIKEKDNMNIKEEKKKGKEGKEEDMGSLNSNDCDGNGGSITYEFQDCGCDECNYLITDSIHLTADQRPSLQDAIILNPREFLPNTLLAVGLLVSFFNIQGGYDNHMYLDVERYAVVLGFLCGLMSVSQAITGYEMQKERRLGIADDRTVTLYAGFYSLAVSWLAVRTSKVCPSWLLSFDKQLSISAIIVLTFGVVMPVLTILQNNNKIHLLPEAPKLSATENTRVSGICALGVLGSVFVPDCIAFNLGAQNWWNEVTKLHPSQTYLESTTALFALFAAEASMVAHRAGKKAVASYKHIVPTFLVVCLMLTIFPCIAALYYLGDDVSFFSYYFYE